MRAIWSLLLVPLLVAAAPATRPVTRPATRPAGVPTGEFLSPTALHVLRLTLTKADWEVMQPSRPNLITSLFATPRPANAERDHDSPFGYRYHFVHASLEADGRAYPDVGLRFKGNSSYLTGRDVKKPFKLDVNHYAAEQTLGGHASVNLNNEAMDGTLLREAMSYQFFRDAGVPASRTAFALVYVNVPDVHDDKLAGLYTLVEEIDRPFLRAHFGSAKGLLLKPEGCFNLPDLGEKFERYEAIYHPKSPGSPETKQRLIEFVKLIHHADDATFARRIEECLDVDAFLRFVAANAMLGNMDSFLSTGHNFYLYIHPTTLKAHFIPWDLNLSFGTFDWVGTLPEQADLNLRQPYVPQNRLTQRVLSVDRFARAYRAECERMARECLAPHRFAENLAMMREVVARAERLTNVPHKALPPKLPAEADLGTFAVRRYESVLRQLADPAAGYVPYWQKGIFGGGFGKPASRPTTTPVAATPK
jgi:hypothetical protein